VSRRSSRSRSPRCPTNSGVRNIARLALVIAASVWAASAIPTGGALDTAPLSGADATNDLLDSFEGNERALVARGRAHEAVGSSAPKLRFRSFSGSTLELEGLERVNVLLFVEPECERCTRGALTLSTLSVVYYEDIYSFVISTDGGATDAAQLVEDAGGAGLIVGAEDTGDEVADAIGIDKRPTLVVVGPTGTFDAIWTEDVPLKTLYTFFETAYDFKSSGEQPYEPFQPSDVQDG
jgi:hypothetical protein